MNEIRNLILKEENWLEQSSETEVGDLIVTLAKLMGVKDKVIECGAFRGMTTSTLLEYFDEVYVLDINNYLHPKIWEDYKHKLKFYQNDSIRTIENLNETFRIGFIDDDHSYKHTYALTKALERLVPKGGLILYHDYNNLSVKQACVQAEKDNTWRLLKITNFGRTDSIRETAILERV